MIDHCFHFLVVIETAMPEWDFLVALRERLREVIVLYVMKCYGINDWVIALLFPMKMVTGMQVVNKTDISIGLVSFFSKWPSVTHSGTSHHLDGVNYACGLKGNKGLFFNDVKEKYQIQMNSDGCLLHWHFGWGTLPLSLKFSSKKLTLTQSAMRH